MNKIVCFLAIIVFGHSALRAQQDWHLEVSSSVELRTLKLTNKAEKDSRPLAGATIALYQGTKLVKQVLTDGNGDFSMAIPPNGEYVLIVSYKDCNAKKFQI